MRVSVAGQDQLRKTLVLGPEGALENVFAVRAGNDNTDGLSGGFGLIDNKIKVALIHISYLLSTGSKNDWIPVFSRSVAGEGPPSAVFYFKS